MAAFDLFASVLLIMCTVAGCPAVMMCQYDYRRMLDSCMDVNEYLVECGSLYMKVFKI